MRENTMLAIGAWILAAVLPQVRSIAEVAVAGLYMGDAGPMGDQNGTLGIRKLRVYNPCNDMQICLH
jgi:hypothetical protein